MTKLEAIEEMKSGKWVRHRFFSEEEKITMEGRKIKTEEGYLIDSDVFWKDRDVDSFSVGWEIVE